MAWCARRTSRRPVSRLPCSSGAAWSAARRSPRNFIRGFAIPWRPTPCRCSTRRSFAIWICRGTVFGWWSAGSPTFCPWMKPTTSKSAPAKPSKRWQNSPRATRRGCRPTASASILSPMYCATWCSKRRRMSPPADGWRPCPNCCAARGWASESPSSTCPCAANCWICSSSRRAITWMPGSRAPPSRRRTVSTASSATTPVPMRPVQGTCCCTMCSARSTARRGPGGMPSAAWARSVRPWPRPQPSAAWIFESRVRCARCWSNPAARSAWLPRKVKPYAPDVWCRI